jgi:hypothetical protein
LPTTLTLEIATAPAAIIGLSKPDLLLKITAPSYFAKYVAVYISP